MKKIAILFLCVLPLLASDLSLDQAADQARKEGKPLLIDFYAVWCGPCKQFKKAAHSDQDIKALLDKVVLIKLDAEHGEGKDAAKKFNVHGYPTFVLVDAEFNTINRWSGYAKEHFTKKINFALSDLRPIEAKIMELEKDPSQVELAESLGSYYQSQGMYIDSLKYFDLAQAHSGDRSFMLNIFANRYMQWRSKEQAYDLAAMQSFAEQAFADRKMSADDRVQVASLMVEYCKKTSSRDAIGPYVSLGLSALKKVSSTDEHVQRYDNQFKVDEALFVKKDPIEAVRIKKATLKQGWQEHANGLNNFAWWCFENRINLPEAALMAQKGVDLAPAGKEKGNILDTLAEIQAASGDLGAAVRSMQMAVKEDPDNSYFKKQLERFQKQAGSNAS